MNCKDIAKDLNYSAELLKQVKAQTTRYFILLVLMSIVCMMLITYIFYDRKKDSEVESTTTETTTEVTQDGLGYNTYVDGIGDVNIGSKDKEDSKNNEK